jgi:cytochrome P450
LADQRAAYDAMREKRPVAYSEFFGGSALRHADVRRVLRDPEVVGNAVSQHLSAPNGMDPPEHTEYRRIIEPYFAPACMQAFQPTCRELAKELLRRGLAKGHLEVMADCGRPFAARAQCSFLGWSSEQADTLVQWLRNNQMAAQAGDRAMLSELARKFEKIIDEQLDNRRQTEFDPNDDLTTSLMGERVWGRALSNEEIASILRNWTGGEVATIAAAVGIVVHYLASHEDLQSELRNHPSRLSIAIDEILRIDGPLATNRRVTTRPIELGGREIEAGERVTMMWISANRDPRVFPEPDQFRWDRDPKLNLLYGAGIHACPGAPLARLELTTFVEELLQHTSSLRLDPDKSPVRAVYPAAGFSQVYVQLQ